MTFPVIAGTAQGNDTSNTTTHTVNLPASISAGDLLIVALAMDGNTTLTWPDANWIALSAITNSGGDGSLEVRYRIATGSEGSTISVTSGASEAGSHISYRITGWHGTTPPEAGTPATGASLNPDPPTVTASWGSDDNLFILAIGFGTSQSNVSVWPTGYTVSQMQDAASNANIAGAAMAARELAAATDDPGALTTGVTGNWVAGTIVVRPAGTPSATLDQTAYRWRNDDGSESAATWKAAQNTDTSIAKETPLRLRLQLDATGDPAGAQYRLDFRQASEQLQADNFNDNSQDTALWNKTAYHDPNASVTVVESGAQLTITPLSSTAGENYNGYLSTDEFDFTGGEVILEVPTVTNGDAVSELLITVDGSITSAGFDAEGGLLYFVTAVAGTFESTNISYNSTDHRWWKFTHETSDDTFRWYTSSDGTNWTQRRSRSRNITITAVRFQILAGSYSSVATPGTMVADNFSANTQATAWAAVAASATKIILAASANITASGEATTAQLTAPAGKTTADFDAGRIQDDENPADSVDITADDYTELEWCIEADTTALAGYDYEFRLSIGGVALDTYTQTPTLTITAAGATINFTATLTAVSDTPTVSLAVARSLAATVTAASNAPDVVSLAVLRSLVATLTAATNTPDVVSLERLIALAATLTGATATPDNANLTVARSLAATLTAVSSTNDAASLAVLRQLAVTLTAASATPDTVPLTVLLQLSAVMTAASATPDTANLVILRQLTATLTAVSSTPDASLSVLRQLVATLTAVTATPDDVTLSVAGFISFAATLTAATATNDTATLSVLRQMAATLTAVSDAPDVVILTVARQMAAVLTAVSDTPEDVSLVIARSLAATITAVSATPDTPSLAVLRQMAATLTAVTDTPDEVNLNISGFIALAATITAATATNDAASLAVLRQLSATMTGATATPEDVALGLIKHFLAALTAVSSTPDGANLIVQRSLAAALTAATNTPDNASLAVLRQLSAAATAQTATPDSVNLITALIAGLISIIFSSRQPGITMTTRQPGATITARQPGASITGRPEGD